MTARAQGRRGSVEGDELDGFAAGAHRRLYDVLGAHAASVDGVAGTRFAVWAPRAAAVAVVGDWNGWDGAADVLVPRGAADGVWERFVPGVGPGALYKLRVAARGGATADKADPFARRTERPPATASVVADLDYEWGDAAWMAARGRRPAATAPMSLYEVHLGSWRRSPEHPDRPLGYRDLAPLLAEHATRHGFTHVELMPVMEHPFYGSWGYQTTGYFAPTARQGAPQDLMFLIDTLHRAGVGVILDWVPSHFPDDPHGLARFDGEPLFEHPDPRRGVQPDWNSLVFDYGRGEVRSFLRSSADFWLRHYHADGLRVDAVASMLYRDFSRAADQWEPNAHGGREHLEAVAFLRDLTEGIRLDHPGATTHAEESTAWPGVTAPVADGGLGFDFKWDMGWMHDTLRYLARDPVHRRFHQGDLAFRSVYAHSERFVLPLSHDEVVHGKGSLLARMPGDAWQRHANVRLLLGYQWSVPGKKLLFMGDEIAQWQEWSHERSLDWHLLDHAAHAGTAAWTAALNRLYVERPALHEGDADPAGFEWVDAVDAERSVLAFLRHAPGGGPPVLAVFNNTPVVRHNYRVGVTGAAPWRELLSSDATEYGGSGVRNGGALEALPVPAHGRRRSVVLTLPPLGCCLLGPEAA